MAPATSAPPALPPSVEEAYRRKCIQLKQRTSEVEEANDAARLRLARLKRQVEKMRLERAFLLEQLAKRTSTNVEDSDGSPSPPPTPKEKPLRMKRGHRKPSAFPGLEASSSLGPAAPGSTFISQNLLVHSPGSDALSASQQPTDASTAAAAAAAAGKTNGVHKPSSAAPSSSSATATKKPRSAFELYCDETRPSVQQDQGKDGKEGGAAEVEEELARRWRELPDSRRAEYQARVERQMAEYEREKEKQKEKEKEAHEAASKAKEGGDGGAKVDKTGSGAGSSGNGSGSISSSSSSNANAAEAKDSERPAAAPAAAGRDEGTQEQQQKQPQPQPQQQRQQEDVEMTNYETDQETQGERPEE